MAKDGGVISAATWGGHMTVLMAASDETAPERRNQDGACVYGGYLALESDWDTFTDAWKKWVLERDPAIPFFRMSNLTNEHGQLKLKLSPSQAERRLESAQKVIKQSPFLLPVIVQTQMAPFATVLSNVTFGVGKRARRVEPDHVGFYRHVMNSAICAHLFHPGAKTLNFVFEAKSKQMTKDFQDLFEVARDELRESKDPDLNEKLAPFPRTELAQLLGSLTPREKEFPPLQAADAAIWICRRAFDRTIPEKERRRAIRSITSTGRQWELNDAAVEKVARELVRITQERIAKPSNVS